MNDRIAESARRFGAEETQFVCECTDPTCLQRVETTLAEFERLRADGGAFLVAPGHAAP